MVEMVVFYEKKKKKKKKQDCMSPPPMYPLPRKQTSVTWCMCFTQRQHGVLGQPRFSIFAPMQLPHHDLQHGHPFFFGAARPFNGDPTTARFVCRVVLSVLFHFFLFFVVRHVFGKQTRGLQPMHFQTTSNVFVGEPH